MTPNKHSRKYSPSKSAIWMQCALSTLLNDSNSGETNLSAEIGSETHELGASLICQSLGIKDYDKETKTPEEVIKELKHYTPEMQSMAEGYANFVINEVEFEKRRSKTEPLVVVEQFLEMPFDEDAGGTLDFGMINSYNGGTLTVIDLKTGRTPIMAFDEATGKFNSQLGLYALYFFHAYKDIYPIHNVRLVIYQPVINNTNDYQMTIEDLVAFEMNDVLPAVERTKLDNPPAVVNSGCRYCAGRSICPMRHQENMNVIKSMDKPVEMLTDAEILEMLPKLDEVIQYANDVKEFAMKKAMNGHKWTGFKLVHSKVQRKITDETAVAKIILEAGFDPYANQKLASITELNKRLGKDKFKELCGGFITLQEGSLTLVPETDSREEINIKEGD